MKGSGSSLPVQPVQILEREEAEPRAAATLPAGSSSGFDVYASELVPHFKSLQLRAGTIIHKTSVDPSCLFMRITNAETGQTYISLVLPNEFTPRLAVVRPHVSLVHDVAPPDWASWYEMKHTLTTLLNPREVTCYFRAGSHPHKYVIDERSELGVLIRMLQRIIINHHPANTPVDVVQELHFTFHQLGHHTV